MIEKEMQFIGLQSMDYQQWWDSFSEARDAIQSGKFDIKMSDMVLFPLRVYVRTVFGAVFHEIRLSHEAMFYLPENEAQQLVFDLVYNSKHFRQKRDDLKRGAIPNPLDEMNPYLWDELRVKYGLPTVEQLKQKRNI